MNNKKKNTVGRDCEGVVKPYLLHGKNLSSYEYSIFDHASPVRPCQCFR